MTNTPDIYVIGAQKSGTTSLCALLDAHPRIAMARPKEPMLLSRDDVLLHPHFFAEHPGDWDKVIRAENATTIAEGYADCFEHADSDQLKADGSTSYLYSRSAPQHVKDLSPDAKIIVILRDPAARAWSAYWHFVKCGLVCEPFAQHLRYESGLTLSGSLYVHHIKRWLDMFAREQFLFLCYEQMLEDAPSTAQTIADFLEIDAWESPVLPKENRGKRPKWLWLQFAVNYLRRRAGIPVSATGESATDCNPLCQCVVEKLTELNLTEAPPPPMDDRLHSRLNRWFKKENTQLEELTGLNVGEHWYK